MKHKTELDPGYQSDFECKEEDQVFNESREKMRTYKRPPEIQRNQHFFNFKIFSKEELKEPQLKGARL